MLRGFSTFVCWAGLCVVSHDALAQNVSPTKLYGDGVHAFHRGDYHNAHVLLSASIEKGNEDPRCYYFRGVALRRIGRPADAAYDFQVGVELESQLADSVGLSLERIQGADRIVLEKYRRQLANERAIRLRSNRSSRSPGEMLPSFDVRRSRSTEVPSSTGLTSLDPADPYASPASIFDAPIGTGVEAIVSNDNKVETESEGEFDNIITDDPAGDDIAGMDIEDFGGNEDTSDSMGDEIFDLDDVGDDLANSSSDEEFDLDSGGDESTSQPAAKNTGGGGALGSIFRALSRAATPKVDLSTIQNQLPIPGGPPGGIPGGPGAEQFPPNEQSPNGPDMQDGGPSGGNPFRDDPL